MCTHNAVDSLATHKSRRPAISRSGSITYASNCLCNKVWIYYFDALELVVVYHLSVIS